MRETLRVVREQEYRKFWGSLPGSLGSACWIVEIAVLGWDVGLWAGALTVAALTLVTRIVPSRLRLSEIVVDVCYFTVMRSNVVRIMWLLLIVDLWAAQARGALSILMVLAVFFAAMLLPFATSRLIVRPLTRVTGGS